MYIHSLYVKQFRNCNEGSFEFSEGVNLFVGPNARGKTSLLEAIYTLMIGKSFRTSQLNDLILKDSPYFYIETLFQKHTIEQKLSFYAEPKMRKMTHNSTSLTSASSLLGIIPGLVITPDDVDLIKGSPLKRRQFLDLQIAQVDPLYVHHLTRYAKAIEQRNQLLKQKKTTSIDVWEHELAKSGAYITLQRRSQLNALLCPAQDYYNNITHGIESIGFRYISSTADCETLNDIQTCLQLKYTKNRSKEFTIGFTLNGPHKDDIEIIVNNKEARTFSSEGQQRSSALAFHLAAWQSMKKRIEISPIMMIDDIAMGLDTSRTDKLINLLEDMGQVFLSSTNPHLLDSFNGNKTILRI